MKYLIITLAFLATFSFTISSQESETTQTREVVTVEGRRTVDVDEANKDVTDKLKKLKEKKQEEREEKKNNKRMIKIGGRIALGVILFGGIAYWRSRKKRHLK